MEERVSPMVFLLLEQMVIVGYDPIVSIVFDALFLYTDTLGYRSQFGPDQYMIFRFDRHRPDDGWIPIQRMGRIQDTLNTLKSLGPFLTTDEVEQLWPPGHIVNGG
jgi:hypothetical protein